MRYKKFVIKGYRGISDSTVIDISKESLIPIIGKNEGGKTTCLQAILAFDETNDELNNGTHLSSIENLYSTVETPVIVSAFIELDDDFSIRGNFKEELAAAENDFKTKQPNEKFDLKAINVDELQILNGELIKGYQILLNASRDKLEIEIERDLKNRRYFIPLLKDILDEDKMDEFGSVVVSKLPYIIYFDDFRDRIPEKLYVVKEKENTLYSSWILYIDELFKQTNPDYSVFSTLLMQDSRRRSIISEVQKKLNQILAKEWSLYQFDNPASIEIEIGYVTSPEGAHLLFKVVETVEVNGNEEKRYFDVSDRSKGFFWYFNFMIRLNCNHSKRHSADIDTIYLLDEPGSYLHSYALDKLTEQLKRLSEKNKVIYCTHSHNLLNPQFIPLNSIRVAEKVSKGKMVLRRIADRDYNEIKKNSAFQPVFDALGVKPLLMDFGYEKVVLVEGIYDYYSFTMFTTDFFSFFPGVSASSISNQIPYMIFLGKKYLAMWDNDSEGRKRMEKASGQFGTYESAKFLVHEKIGDEKNATLESYFDSNELNRYCSEMSLNDNTSLYKVILHLFYGKSRNNMIKEYFPVTHKNFVNMESALKKRFDIVYASSSDT